MMRHVLTVAAMASVFAFGGSAAAWGEDAQPATSGSDTLVVLVSDTNFGPDMEDAAVAARFYCTSRAKIAEFVSKERPPEMRTQVMQQWSVLTYRCVTAPQAK